MEKELSPRQREIYEYIVAHIELHGYPPTVREIGKAVDLSSSSTVHAHLRNLEDAGLIKREAILTRAISIVSGSESAPKPKKVVNLPIVGQVAAGKPMLAVEDIQETYPVPQEMLSGQEGFMLLVKGESMIEDGIHDGDYVIVRKQQTATNGETIVAMVDNEATVKRFYLEDNRVRLQPANKTMQPMYYPNVDVIGKVVGLVRKMA